MRVYISGKITGDNYAEVVEKFADAEAQISDLQYFPINPIKNGLPPIATWDEHMVKDIELLLTCDAIYMLTDWEESKGARIEHFIAAEKGMELWYQPIFMNYKRFKS